MKQQHYRFAITPLSPVHMGTDDDYEPTGYVIDGGALFEFDAIAALQALPENERKRLDQILSGKPTDRMLREVQGFFYNNRERLIVHSRRQVRVNETIEKFYQSRVGRVAQHEHGGRKVQNRLEIERTAWNPVSGEPILPGSGLKGAIRTALLNEVNDGRRPKRNERNRDLQNRLFGFRSGKFELDPMRLIRLSDAPLREGGQLSTEVFFALNRKKRPVEKNGALVQSRAEQQGLYQLLECLPPLHPRAFSGTLEILDPNGIGRPGYTTPEKRFTLSDIARACNRFYRPIFDAELQLLRRRGYVDDAWASRMERLLERLAPTLDADRAFLLRAGRHSGAESVTLKGVRSIKIMKGKREKPDYLDSAKTLWLAGHERQAQRGLLPFGWLLVEIDPDGNGPWQETASPEGDRKWLDGVRQRIASLRRAHEQEEHERLERQRRLQAEAAARQAAEEAARRQAEEEQKRKQAEFDALPEWEKAHRRLDEALQRLPETLTKNRYPELVGLLNNYQKEAETWPAEARQEAARRIEAAYDRYGWGTPGQPAKKKRKQEQKKREQLARLRGEG